jgi:hypothetical protein
LELVRYIHLNPLRAKQVTSLKQLDRYRYSGHSAVMGNHPNDWQATDALLRIFGKSVFGSAGAVLSKESPWAGVRS